MHNTFKEEESTYWRDFKGECISEIFLTCNKRHLLCTGIETLKCHLPNLWVFVKHAHFCGEFSSSQRTGIIERKPFIRAYFSMFWKYWQVRVTAVQLATGSWYIKQKKRTLVSPCVGKLTQTGNWSFPLLYFCVNCLQNTLWQSVRK